MYDRFSGKQTLMQSLDLEKKSVKIVYNYKDDK